MKNAKKYVLILCAAVMMLALTACGKQKVDIGNYLSVNYRGSNGAGTAYVSLDYAQLEHEIMSGWSDKEQTWENLARLTALETTITCEPSSVEGLSNGDKITVTVTYDEKQAKKLGCSFQNTKQTFKVEGLKDAIMLDPFDESVFGPGKMVNVEIENRSPRLSVSIKNQAEYGDPYGMITYRLAESEKDYQLANGDTVTITAELSHGIDQYALSRTETTLTLGGYESYVTDLTMLDHEDTAYLLDYLDSAVNAILEKDYPMMYFVDHTKHDLNSDYASCSGLNFLGYGYATPATWDGQFVLIPFQGEVTARCFWRSDYRDLEEDEKETVFPNACGYFAIRGLYLNGDGKCVFDNMYMDLKFFENEDLMKTDIAGEYGPLQSQNFN